jgi:hypothetical protein
MKIIDSVKNGNKNQIKVELVSARGGGEREGKEWAVRG